MKFSLRLFLYCSCLIVLHIHSAAYASTYLDLNDEAYSLLSRLEAEGVIQSGLLTTKPLSRSEAVRLLREAEENSRAGSEFLQSLVRELRGRIRPETAGPGVLELPDTAYATYAWNNAGIRTLTYGVTREKEQAFNSNNNGDLYARDGNERLGVTARMEDIAGFSLFLNPEFRSSQGGSDNRLVLRSGYAVYDFGWDLVAGRDSQWWGPGYHGALLLSNNAQPLTMVKIANPHPFVLPWMLHYLGPMDVTLFATQLEEDRPDAARPYLWGMRVNFKPLPVVEVGLERTALLGGRGRSVSWHTWIDSVLGKNEHHDPEVGDQRAGYDIKVTAPFDLQPVQIYMEAVAEDSVHTVPSQWAYIYGLYLPRLLSLERVEFRVEWARTDNGNGDRESSFYLHHIYTSGYTYHGSIIGHWIGTDSRDIYSELTFRFPEQRARVSLSLDRAEHNVSGNIHETDHEILLRGRFGLRESLDVELIAGYSLIYNAALTPGADVRSILTSATVQLRF
jgi:hypothetical protein